MREAVPRGLIKHPNLPDVKVAGLNSSAWSVAAGPACAKNVGILSHAFRRQIFAVPMLGAVHVLQAGQSNYNWVCQLCNSCNCIDFAPIN